MRFTAWSIALVVAACGTSPMRDASQPVLTQPTAFACGALVDEKSCDAQPACLWQQSLAPCMVGDAGPPCDPGHCVAPSAPGPVDSRVACGCAQGPNIPAATSFSFCVRAKGSTAVTCEPLPAGCPVPSVDDTDPQSAAVCACVSQPSRPCKAASDVRSLCDCG